MMRQGINAQSHNVMFVCFLLLLLLLRWLVLLVPLLSVSTVAQMLRDLSAGRVTLGRFQRKAKS